MAGDDIRLTELTNRLETPMTSPTQRRHEELVALLAEIRDRLPERPTFHDLEDVAADIVEEPPRGSQVTDRGGDVWERREEGWALWWPERSGWIAELYEGGAFDPWAVVRDQAPLRPTTDEDRKRVGLPVEEACDCGSRPEEIGGAAHRIGCPEPAPADVDPDEALRAALNQEIVRQSKSGEVEIEVYNGYGLEAGLARAAREHIEAEKSRMGAALYYGAPARARAERAEAERDEWRSKFEQTDNLLSRTRDERDDATARAESWRDANSGVLAERDAALDEVVRLRAKHAAFRADVERGAHYWNSYESSGKHTQNVARAAGYDLTAYLDRDDARDPQAD